MTITEEIRWLLFGRRDPCPHCRWRTKSVGDHPDYGGVRCGRILTEFKNIKRKKALDQGRCEHFEEKRHA